MSFALRLSLLAATLAASLVAALGMGPVHVPLGASIDILRDHILGQGTTAPNPSHDAIIWLIRGPRVLAAAIVGAALAASGAALQAIVRNDLADPFLLGVSSGASFGAALTLLAGVTLGAVSLTTGAFIGALTAIALVLALVRVGGSLHVDRLVLSGIAVSFFLGALTNLVVVLSDRRDAARSVLFWMLGSLTQVTWAHLPGVFILTLLMIAFLVITARRLDQIALGDDIAHSLGTHPTRYRALVTLTTALGVAAAVAISGSIGFIGLVVPHLTRPLVGSSHRKLIPASTILGALLLVWADALARTALSPREIPVGVLTAILGTPLLLILIRRSHNHHA